jgi:hypothetical protein
MKEIGRGVVLYNKVMTLADTEYSQTLPEGTVKILIQNRGLYDTKVSFASSTSGTNYMTIRSNAVYYEDMINMSRTLYFQCPSAAQTLEIIVWVK